MKFIYCPGVYTWLPVKAFIKAIKTAKSCPTYEFQTGYTTAYPTKGRGISRQFLRSIHERINKEA